MFENILRELNNLQGTHEINITIHPDKDGFIDRECPDEKCHFQFKVNEEDWKNLFQDDHVYCPMCRHDAEATSWFTTDQINKAEKRIHNHIETRIGNVLYQDAIQFNASQSSNSWLKMSAYYQGRHGSTMIPPILSTDEMEMKIQCEKCHARYAVVGSAFFCPCCGHNSAEETFDNAAKKIRTKVGNITEIKAQLASTIGKDDAENICRSLVETSLGDCVVAFQRFCEVSFGKIAPGIQVPPNAFQNLETGAKQWQLVLGNSYGDWLSSKELYDLKVFFQKRHLLAHREGMVDQKYINNTGDKAYEVGQRIILKPDDIFYCLELTEKIISNLRQEMLQLSTRNPSSGTK